MLSKLGCVIFLLVKIDDLLSLEFGTEQRFLNRRSQTTYDDGRQDYQVKDRAFYHLYFGNMLISARNEPAKSVITQVLYESECNSTSDKSCVGAKCQLRKRESISFVPRTARE